MTTAPLSPAHRALALRPRSGNVIRVYWWLCGELDAVEYRPVKVARVARRLAMRRSRVFEALATLRREGYVERGGRAFPQGPYQYRLRTDPEHELEPPVAGTGPSRAA